MVHPLRTRLPVLASLVLLAACGGGGGGGGGSQSPLPGACIVGTGPEVVVSGSVAYERLQVTANGLGGLVTLPARFVDVQVRVAGGGTCYGQAATDGTGAFALPVRPPAGSQLEVHAFSRTTLAPDLDVAVHDALPPALDSHATTNHFQAVSAPFAAGSAAPVVLTVPYNAGTADRPSIGFSVLDVLVTCTQGVVNATGIVPPACHAYTTLGNNGATGTSFYASAANAITFLGGAAGNLDGSDTDYFDDAVIAHEYGHFLEFQLAHTLTRGGAHGGEELEPNFAWSEGQATGFGSLLRGQAAYIDTTGTSGGTLINASAENWPQAVRGIGGEESVAEIVWDLGDGLEGRMDTDADVAQVPLSTLLDAFFSFDPATDAPYVGLFLDRVVAGGGIAAGALAVLLLSPENQAISYPLAGDDVWPVALGVPDTDGGIVDATVANPCRALAASRWYVLRLAASTTVRLELQIQPLTGFGSDVNLHLLRCSGATVQSAFTGNPVVIGPVALDAGCYLVRVEASCAGAGNRAIYTLTASEVP